MPASKHNLMNNNYIALTYIYIMTITEERT